MKQTLYITSFAQAYGEGAYNCGTYSGTSVNAQDGVCATTTSPGGQTVNATLQGQGGLSWATIILLAFLFALSASLLIGFIHRHRKQKAEARNQDDFNGHL